MMIRRSNHKESTVEAIKSTVERSLFIWSLVVANVSLSSLPLALSLYTYLSASLYTYLSTSLSVCVCYVCISLFKKKTSPKDALRTSKREMSVATRGIRVGCGMMFSMLQWWVLSLKNDSTSNCESAGRNGMKIGVKTKKIEQNQHPNRSRGRSQRAYGRSQRVEQLVGRRVRVAGAASARGRCQHC